MKQTTLKHKVFDGIGTSDDDFRIVKRKLFALKKKPTGWKGKIRGPQLLRGRDSRGIQFVELIEVWSSLVSNWMPNYGLLPVDRTFIETLMFFRSIVRHRSGLVRWTNAILFSVSRNSIETANNNATDCSRNNGKLDGGNRNAVSLRFCLFRINRRLSKLERNTSLFYHTVRYFPQSYTYRLLNFFIFQRLTGKVWYEWKWLEFEKIVIK